MDPAKLEDLREQALNGRKTLKKTDFHTSDDKAGTSKIVKSEDELPEGYGKNFNKIGTESPSKKPYFFLN